MDCEHLLSIWHKLCWINSNFYIRLSKRNLHVLMNYSAYMTIPLLKVIQNLRERQPSHATARHHLVLTGIRQNTFLQNWGEPEFCISLKRLGSFCREKSLYLVVSSDNNEADFSILIYRKKHSVLFFTRKKLITHFKWRGFEEKSNELKGGINVNSTTISLPLIA